MTRGGIGVVHHSAAASADAADCAAAYSDAAVEDGRWRVTGIRFDGANTCSRNVAVKYPIGCVGQVSLNGTNTCSRNVAVQDRGGCVTGINFHCGHRKKLLQTRL